MTYVLDTGFFVLCRDYYPDTFLSFWEKLNQLVQNNIISSVEFVAEELKRYGGEQEYLLSWIKNNKQIFTQPSLQEEEKIREIFSNKDFQTLLQKKQRQVKNEIADPFVIAKAIICNSAVVTTEKPTKQQKDGKINGNYKIPDICRYYHTRSISPQVFMKELNWQF